MKKTIINAASSIGLLATAQVGIKTEAPKATLDVNGDVNFRNKIAVQNATDNSLFQGNNDQLLVCREKALLLSGNHSVFLNTNQ